MTRTTCEVNKEMHKEMTKREEKKDIVGIEDTYPWPQPSAHHQWPYQSQKPISSQPACHWNPQGPLQTPRRRTSLRHAPKLQRWE